VIIILIVLIQRDSIGGSIMDRIHFGWKLEYPIQVLVLVLVLVLTLKGKPEDFCHLLKSFLLLSMEGENVINIILAGWWQWQQQQQQHPLYIF